jgi:2-polyprenyl-3-methyl-5-hydroxy-6-metoxy-1,4-benzoquinol methylase
LEPASIAQTPAPPPAGIGAIIASYDSWLIWSYALVRFAILRQSFLEEIGQYLPERGRVLDVGCGFGLFSLYFASRAPGRTIVGSDVDARRIAYARTSAERLGLANVSYEVADATRYEPPGKFDAIYLLDLVHHLPRAGVPAFLAKLRAHLNDGGVLLVKEVEDRPRWKRWFTLALDRLMVGAEPIRYWPAHELVALLAELGFDVVRHRMRDVLPYPHILYVARAPR